MCGKLWEKLKKKKNLMQFIKFGLVGISNSIVSYAVYAALVLFGLHYMISYMLGYFAGICNSFYWNEKYVFTAGEGEKRSKPLIFLKVLCSYLGVGFVLQNLLMWAAVDRLHMSKWLVPLIIDALVMVINFIVNKKWSFKEQPHRRDG